MPPSPLRVAAIDIGTNSIHMIVAELRPSGYRVVDKEKEMVQLGSSSLDGAPLREEAIERGLVALTHMAEVARGWMANEIIAVATSAVREAPNRREFLRRVKGAAGIKVRVISGEQEAAYIFRAVRSAIDLDDGNTLCVDIGGGSVEFIIGTRAETFFTASEPLGSLRLAQRFSLEDVAKAADVEACRRFAEDHLGRVQKQARKLGIDQSIGTSGTIQALASLTGSSEDSSSVARAIERETLGAVLEQMTGTRGRERVDRLGIEEKRANTIVAGAAVLVAIMDTLGLQTLLSSPVGIREGIIEARLHAHGEPLRARSLRRSSVRALAERSDCDIQHSRHVARLALSIFDQTVRLHALPLEMRELLEHAALLHEVGMNVSTRGYQQHTYYLVRHAALGGFTERQIKVVSNIARYHRKSEPDDDDPNLTELIAAERGDVAKLAAILRIAKALDRSHRQAVREVAVHDYDDVRFLITARADVSVEIKAAAKRARYFSRLFERKVRVQLE